MPATERLGYRAKGLLGPSYAGVQQGTKPAYKSSFHPVLEVHRSTSMTVEVLGVVLKAHQFTMASTARRLHEVYGTPRSQEHLMLLSVWVPGQ